MNSIRDVWLQFRLGHSVYLAFLLQMGNFVIISYTLFLSRFELGIELGMAEFVLLFALIYIPTAIIMGRTHIRHQYSTESRATFEHNPVIAKMHLTLIKILDGTATKEEVEGIKTYLESIVDIDKDRMRTNKGQ